MSSQQPLSPTFASHVGDQPSTSDNKVKGKKGRVKLPCRLCSGCHLTYLCLCIEEASKLLEDSIIAQQQSPASSQNPCPEQPLVEEVVQSKPSSTSPTLPSESDESTTHVSFTSSIFFCIRGFPRWSPTQALRSFPLIRIVY